MIEYINKLIASTMKEQESRSQAELWELQLQIRPHFLYNSLSYITTVANRPEAVTEMAVHLAKFISIEYENIVPDELQRIEIMPLILQPIIENSIEQALEK